jgi:hypothetical protein
LFDPVDFSDRLVHVPSIQGKRHFWLAVSA